MSALFASCINDKAVIHTSMESSGWSQMISERADCKSSLAKQPFLTHSLLRTICLIVSGFIFFSISQE
jgi:hypothetical protein